MTLLLTQLVVALAAVLMQKIDIELADIDRNIAWLDDDWE